MPKKMFIEDDFGIKQRKALNKLHLYKIIQCIALNIKQLRNYRTSKKDYKPVKKSASTSPKQGSICNHFYKFMESYLNCHLNAPKSSEFFANDEHKSSCCLRMYINKCLPKFKGSGFDKDSENNYWLVFENNSEKVIQVFKSSSEKMQLALKPGKMGIFKTSPNDIWYTKFNKTSNSSSNKVLFNAKKNVKNTQDLVISINNYNVEILNKVLPEKIKESLYLESYKKTDFKDIIYMLLNNKSIFNRLVELRENFVNNDEEWFVPNGKNFCLINERLKEILGAQYFALEQKCLNEFTLTDGDPNFILKTMIGLDTSDNMAIKEKKCSQISRMPSSFSKKLLDLNESFKFNEVINFKIIDFKLLNFSLIKKK